MVMVWLEGGQGEVRGACAPLPPQHPKSPHLDPPPNRPSRSPPPPKPLLDPPPMETTDPGTRTTSLTANAGCAAT